MAKSTTDAASAKKFYTTVFPWRGVDMPAGPGMTYTMFYKGDHDVSALYPQNRFLSSRVRVFIDYLAELYGAPPPWERILKVKLPDLEP